MKEMPSTAGWVRRSELDLLLAANLSAVEDALSRPGAMVFGWHYYFRGGSSRTGVQFHDFGSYLQYIERARPGDHFTLFDLDSIAAQAFLRRGAANSSARLNLDDDEWNQLRELLEDRSEGLVVVRRFVGPLTGTTHSDVDELWNPDDDEWTEFRRQLLWGLGEVLFFSDQVLDLDSDGNQVNCVTPNSAAPRVHALVDAKRPSSEGLVPLHGPY